MTAGGESGTCPSGKLRYATEYEARVELVGTVIGRNRGKHKRRECRWYLCDRCHGWHLTSMPAAPQAASA